MKYAVTELKFTSQKNILGQILSFGSLYEFNYNLIFIWKNKEANAQ